MKLRHIFAFSLIFFLVACGGEPTEQERLVGAAQDFYVRAQDEANLTEKRGFLRASERILREAYEADRISSLGQRIISGRAVRSSVASTRQKIELDIIIEEIQEVDVALHIEQAHNLVALQSAIRNSFLGTPGVYHGGEITARLDGLNALPASVNRDENAPHIFKTSLGHRLRITTRGDRFMITYENIRAESCINFLTPLSASLRENSLPEIENFKMTFISSRFNSRGFSLMELTPTRIDTICNSAGNSNRLEFAFR